MKQRSKSRQSKAKQTQLSTTQSLRWLKEAKLQHTYQLVK